MAEGTEIGQIVKYRVHEDDADLLVGGTVAGDFLPAIVVRVDGSGRANLYVFGSGAIQYMPAITQSTPTPGSEVPDGDWIELPHP